MADKTVWDTLTPAEQQAFHEFYAKRTIEEVCVDFVPASEYVSPQDYKKPDYPEGDLRPIAVVRSSGLIRLDAPSIFAYPPKKVVWVDAENKYTKTTVYNGVETKEDYVLTVKNKGTENEEVTRLTLPTGEYIDFEGWDI